MIGKLLARGSLTRRIAGRAVLVLGAVWIGGLITRSFPRDQLLVFPVGSVFPNATHFSASWQQAGDSEPRGGVTLSFTSPPPLQIRQHAALPNGDYLIRIEVVLPGPSAPDRPPARAPQIPPNAEVSPGPRGVQTNIERRVTLLGGETMIALASGGF